MEDPIPNSHPNDDVSLLPIPPLDDDMFAGDFAFQEDFLGAGNDDFPLDIDFDFIVDDFSFAEDLLLDPLNVAGPDPPGSDLSQARTPISEEVRNSNVVRVYDQEPISSRDSNCKSNSGVSLATGNNSDRDVSSSAFVNNNSDNSCENGDFDRKEVNIEVKLVNNKKCIISKRKKEQQEQLGEGRTGKFRRSSVLASESADFIASSDGDDKKKARLMRNRESAQLSRQRKKQYVEELEDKVRSMHSTITELNSKIMHIMSENACLRQQLSGGAPPLPPPGMYPMPPMAYPWMPCPPYMLNPHGSQAPLVPIPRLKPQLPTPAHKGSKKSGGKKSEGKIKKVASVSLLGLLFFFLLFGGLLPMVSVKYGGMGNRFDDLQKGTVLMVDKHEHRIGYGGGMGVLDGKLNHHGRILQQSTTNASNGFGSMGNSSEPLVASLYVPRNDKMIKIDGNLIIHSVLSSEKAMASLAAEETSLAIPRNYKAYPIPEPGRTNVRHHHHLDGNPSGRQRALACGSPELEPARSDGKLQQWFREGHAGPMLSSGMCTEVFQFDISPLPGAIVTATPIANTTSSKLCQNSTHPNKQPRNRRILHEHPTRFDINKLNATKDHGQPHEPSDGLQSNNSRSSMVVSVLVDPREVGDGDGESVIRSKASRIFVVVLMDSVKYVTYSCMLPFVGSGPHLVTA